jgi:hypothetical protein
MKNIANFRSLSIKILSLAVIFILAIASSAYALRMTKMPEQLQSTVSEPRMRTISLKLPLRQPEFHWTFLSRKQFLAGKLTLRVTRNDKTTEIIICENGRMSEGWEPLTMPANPKAGELYFGFQSTKKYATAPNDQLEIELHVAKDLEGIGPNQTGTLPAGTYKSKGTYSGLLDEYKVPGSLDSTNKETLDKLRKMYEFKAFLENWQDQWQLRITSEDGWLSPQERQNYDKMMEQLRKANNESDKSK